MRGSGRMSDGVCGRQDNVLPKMPVSIFGACEYVMLHGKGEISLQVALRLLIG